MIDERNLSSFISTRIKFLRENTGYTVNALAYKAGVSQSYVRDIELGIKTNISVEKLYQICLVLGCSLEQFFNDKYVPSPPNPLHARLNNMTEEQQEKLLDFLNAMDE